MKEAADQGGLSLFAKSLIENGDEVARSLNNFLAVLDLPLHILVFIPAVFNHLA